MNKITKKFEIKNSKIIYVLHQLFWILKKDNKIIESKSYLLLIKLFI